MQTNNFKLSVVGANIPNEMRDFLSTEVKGLNEEFNEETNEWEYGTSTLFEWWIEMLSSFIAPNSVNYNYFISRSTPFSWSGKMCELYAYAVDHELLDDGIELHPFEFEVLVSLSETIVTSYWEAYRSNILTLSGTHYVRDVEVSANGDLLLSVGERNNVIGNRVSTETTIGGITPKYSLA